MDKINQLLDLMLDPPNIRPPSMNPIQATISITFPASPATKPETTRAIPAIIKSAETITWKFLSTAIPMPNKVSATPITSVTAPPIVSATP